MEHSQKKKKKIPLNNLHKNNLLHQILSNDSKFLDETKLKSEYFNSFIYTDHITNDTMALKKQFIFKSSSPLYRYSQKQQFGSTNSNSMTSQCLSLAKSTRRFHLNSLQSKNYKQKSSRDSQYRTVKQKNSITDKTEKQKLIEYIKRKKYQHEKFGQQKRILNQFLQFNIHNKSENKQQNQQHPNKQTTLTGKQVQLQIQGNKLDNQAERPTFPRSLIFNKNVYQKSNSFHKSKRLPLKQIQVNPKRNEKNKGLKDNIFLRRKQQQKTKDKIEKQILQSTNQQISYLVRKNGQFLVTPKLSKRLFIKPNHKKKEQPMLKQFKQSRFSNLIQSNQNCTLHDNQRLTHNQESLNQYTNSSKYFKPGELEQYQFQYQDQNKIFTKLKDFQTQNGKADFTQQQILIIKAIQEGNFFKVQIQLSVNPTLLLTRQTINKNNLLHICIMNNKIDIFQMILKKCSEHKVDLLYQKNKYGRNPLDLGHILSFFQRQSTRLLVSSFQKQIMTAAYQFSRNLL